MASELFNIINAAFGIAAALTFLVVGAVWYFSIKWTERTTRIDTEHSALSANIAKISDHIDEMRKDLAYLKGSVEILQNNKAKALMQSNSPIALTDEGRRVASEMKSEDLISANWERINSTLLAANLATAYDVQQFCMETASVEPSKFFDETTLNKVKKYAFLHGMPLQLYLRLLGIIIRDKYFELNGVSIDEVDNSDPRLKP